MERIFNNSSSAGLSAAYSDRDDENWYDAYVKAMIDDAVEYEESYLGPIREQNQRYYYGDLPGLISPEDDELGEGEELQQSSVTSTDVRDTVMSILPSLMRTLASSTAHVVGYISNTAEGVAGAEQATDYVHYKFWEENKGFLTLHGAIKDCLTVKLGVMTWWSDTSIEVKEKQFSNVHVEQLALLLEEAEAANLEPQVMESSPPDARGFIQELRLQYKQSKPSLKVIGVPPEEFRISRRAKDVQSADLVGRQTLVRTSDLIQEGFDEELIMNYAGANGSYSEEASIRNGGMDQFDVLGDLVDYGEYYVRIDSDGDGINELHFIKTVGDNHVIIEDTIVNHTRYALFQSDPRSHTAIGDCPADLVLEIQDIKSNILRASLDSLAETLNPRTVINETLVNVSDALSTDRGAVIRTKGDPSATVKALTTEFVGQYGFAMMDQIDRVRQARTGISEASKGMDPKALQSTNVMGVDAIVTGAQERIELIARILAETGMKDLFKGLLREIVDNPNPVEMIPLRGKYVEVNPSAFDADMRCHVNPSLGKGSDQTRLATLMEIRQTQTTILTQYGFNNPIVSIREFLNTTEDILAINNIRNISRYFKPITDEQIEAIAKEPKQPTPEEMIAGAEVEKNKKDIAVQISKVDIQRDKMAMDDDFRRDKMNIDGYLTLASIFKDVTIAEQQQQSIGAMNEAP